MAEGHEQDNAHTAFILTKVYIWRDMIPRAMQAILSFLVEYDVLKPLVPLPRLAW